MNESVLYLIFKNTLGNSFTITVDAPRDDLEEQQIVDAMNLIKQKNIFQPKGYDIAETVSAKIVQSNTTVYDLVV